MPPAVQRESGCELGIAYPRPVVVHKEAYDRAKRRLMEAREAMGFPGAAAAPSNGASRKRRAPEKGNRLIDEMLQQRVCVPQPQAAESASPNADAASWAAAEARSLHPTAAHGVYEAAREPQQHGGEGALARLCALGFPPDLVRRALLAYPTDLDRAADWLLQADEW